ncbi:MAG TPA: fibronectin type III domain-containing protein [Trebonia sp.]|nr:fibronectin type III domain-containing protein [Trebonia sp.]
MSFDAPASVPDPDSVAAAPAAPAEPGQPAESVESWPAPGVGEFLGGPTPGGDTGGGWVFPAPPASSLPSVPRRRRPPKPSRRLVIATCGVVAAGLVAGLLVWAPWNPAPNPPASVSAQSKTATTVTVSWPAASGGAKPASYLVLRDGKQAGQVPASETSWTDHGLAPGTTHRYTVETVGGGQTSGASVIATVTTLAPSPVGLSVTANYSQATLQWKPSPLGPTPSGYTIYNGSTEVMNLPGTTTSYTDGGQQPGSPYKYSVVAQWGSHKSRPSATAAGAVLSPPLNSNVQVQVTPTYIPSGATGATVGRGYGYSWSFDPICEVKACTMTVDAEIPTTGGKYFPFEVAMVGDGAGYSGSFTKAKLTECSSVQVSGTITVTLTPEQGQISNGAWGGWTGKVVLSTPYTSVGGGSYCPASDWNFSLSGNGQRGVAQPT